VRLVGLAELNQILSWRQLVENWFDESIGTWIDGMP
jgi:hypothetical protein